MVKWFNRGEKMVKKLILIIEGGVLPHPKISVQIAERSDKLREGFYKLFEQKIPRKLLDIRMDIEMGSGRNKARDIFIERLEQKENAHLLVDLEDRKKNRKKQLDALEVDEYGDVVFFMVEKMEAWFLSQPDKIELFCEDFLRSADTPIQEDIKKPADEIRHPDNVLKTILKRRFYEEKRDKKVKRGYKKLSDGAALLELLDLAQLQKDFDDVHRLINTLQTKIATNA